MKKIILLLIIIFLALPTLATPKYFMDSNDKTVPPDPVYNKVITAPSGYILGVNGLKSININSIDIFDKIEFTLKNDFMYSGKIIAPEGSLVVGTVVNKNFLPDVNKAFVNIKFTKIITPQGYEIPVSAILNTKDNSGLIYADVQGILDFGEDNEIVLKQPVTYVLR